MYIINDLKTRLEKADKLKQTNIYEFDKHIFTYCKLKALNTINENKKSFKSDVFWFISASIISYIDENKLIDIENLSNFIEDLEDEYKNYKDIHLLYIIIFEFLRELDTRKEKE